MPAQFGGASIGAMQFNGKNIAEAMIDGKIVWKSASLPDLLNLDSAKTTKYRVAFAGSSTMQGWNQPRYESTAHLLTARLLRHPTGANASQMVSQTTGTLGGPNTSGFHFLNAALGGTKASNYLDTTKRNLVNSFSPQLLIHMVGSNDYSEQVPPATYKSNMRSSIMSIGTTTTKHVLVHQQRREDRADTGYTWAQYGQALRELSEEMDNVYFVDVSKTWHTLRGGATDWFAADRIHCTWKGAQGLATAIANEMQLDEHIGETIWAISGEDQGEAGYYKTSLSPTLDSLVSLPATSPNNDVRPAVQVDGVGKVITYNYAGLRYSDTATWGSAYSFPITFFVVQREFGTTGVTQVQPWFSRSIGNDDGWWWAWRDANSSEVRAALNSAFSGAVTYSAGKPLVIAIHMTANNRGTVWVNSLLPVGELAPDRIDANPGPWMKSVRLNANSSLASYGAHQFYELRFEQSGYSFGSIQDRMRQLAEKYGITLAEKYGITLAGQGGSKLDTGARDIASVGLSRNTWTDLDSYKVPTDRAYTVDAAATVTWSSISTFLNLEYRIRLLCEGQVLAEDAVRPTLDSPMQSIQQRVTIPAGATVLFQAISETYATADRKITSGTWRLVEP